jgi:hypothetical protein
VKRGDRNGKRRREQLACAKEDEDGTAEVEGITRVAIRARCNQRSLWNETHLCSTYDPAPLQKANSGHHQIMQKASGGNHGLIISVVRSAPRGRGVTQTSNHTIPTKMPNGMMADTTLTGRNPNCGRAPVGLQHSGQAHDPILWPSGTIDCHHVLTQRGQARSPRAALHQRQGFRPNVGSVTVQRNRHRSASDRAPSVSADRALVRVVY